MTDRGTWAVAEAKARFKRGDRPRAFGRPQTIIRKGREAVVVVSAEEWNRRIKRKGNPAEFFAVSPLRASGVRIQGNQDRPREIEL
jgi:hypothetical protein